MSDSADWRAYAAPITAALIARLPPDQVVTPAQAAELFEQVRLALFEQTKAPAKRSTVGPFPG